MRSHQPSGWVVGSLVTLILTLPALQALFGFSDLLYGIPILGLFCVLVFRLTIGRCSRPGSVAVLYASVILTLCGWLAGSSGWAPQPIRYMDELVLLGYLGVLAVLTTYLTDDQVVEKLVVLVAAAAALVSCYVGWSYITTGSLRGWENPFLAERYLTLSSLLGLGATVSTLRFVAGGKKAWGLTGLGCFVGVGLSLARGALLSSILVVLGFAVAYNVFFRIGYARYTVERKALRGRILWVLGFCALAIGGALSVARTNARLRFLLESGIGGRAQIWTQALDGIAREPIMGHGLGAGAAAIGLAQDTYPHNILLQFWLDGGVIAIVLGLLMVCIPLTMGLGKSLGYRTGPMHASALALTGGFAFMALELMKSTDAYSARSLVIIGCMLVVIGGSKYANLERFYGKAD